MAVLVGADGSVENRVMDLPLDVPTHALAEAANYMSAMLSGLTLGEAQVRLDEEIAQGRGAEIRRERREVDHAWYLVLFGFLI